MHRPVLVTPPAIMPVTLEEAKAHLPVDFDDDDALIEGLIKAATANLDGWTGILGRCLVEQTWDQEFDGFQRDLCLPLGPVISLTTVTWRNAAGQVSTIAPAAYDLRTDAGGSSLVRFDKGYSFPGDLHESRAVAVTYQAGYETVPAPLKIAILMLVAHWYHNRKAVTGDAANVTPLAFDALVGPYRRVAI